MYRRGENLILGVSRNEGFFGLIAWKLININNCLNLLILSKTLKSWMINTKNDINLMQENASIYYKNMLRSWRKFQCSIFQYCQ